MRKFLVALTAFLCTMSAAEENAKEGKVFVKSEPPGAAVFWVTHEGDKNSLKDTGKKTNCLVSLPEGKQWLVFKLDGYEDATLEVKTDPAAIEKYNAVHLERPRRPIDVIFGDENWTLWIDGKPAIDSKEQPATTPCTLKLANGVHEFVLIKEGFNDISQKAVVDEKTARIELLGRPMKSDRIAAADKKAAAYFYAEPVTGKGGVYDYSDKDCTKLLDNKFQDTFSALCVGWHLEKPCPIVVHFPQRVMLRLLRVHVMVQRGGGVGAPAGIQVYAGTKEAKGALIVEAKPTVEKTDWIEIPVKKSSQFFWIVMQQSNTGWVLIDEIDCK